MRGSWQAVIDSVLRPARPDLGRCVAAREAHLAAERPRSDARARAIKDCERRIELARAAVFAANNGVIPATMTALEREWRRLTRPDADSGLMDLWARIAPAAWIDQKRWRDTDGPLRLDAAIALAADADGVAAAEAALQDLRSAVPSIGRRVRFRLAEQDSKHCAALLAEPFCQALQSVARRGDESVIVERARRFEREVHDTVLARFPARPLLAKDLAHAAFVDDLQNTTAVRSLRALWSTGYVLADVDASGVTLEIPPL